MYSAIKSAQTLLDRPGSQRFIWADRCGVLAGIMDTAQQPDEGQCLLYGALAGERLFIDVLQPDTAVESGVLLARLAAATGPLSTETEQRRRAALAAHLTD